jgi:hypothetical protein
LQKISGNSLSLLPRRGNSYYIFPR